MEFEDEDSRFGENGRPSPSPTDSVISSEERYRLLADTMLQGVVHQDARGFVIAMNPTAERILGKTRAELLGNTSTEVEKETIREDGTLFPGVEHPSMVALRTGEPVRGVTMGVWHPIMRDYRWIKIDAVPIFKSGETRPCEVYSVFEDITEQRLARQQLEESEQTVRGVLDSLPEHVMVLDEAGNICEINAACEQFSLQNGGRPKAASLGVNYLEICRKAAATGDRIAEKVLRHLEDLLGHRSERFSLEYTCDAGDGGRWFMLNAQRMQKGRPGIILSHIDITSQKQNEAKLVEVDQHKDRFLAILAHELRNPLAPIRAAADLFKFSGTDVGLMQESVGVIDRQINHMARLLEDLLDVSRINHQQLELRLENVSLQQVLLQALETSQPWTRAGHIKVVVNLPTNAVMLLADPVRLSQLFSNLLNNAVKYSEPESEVYLTAECHQSEVWVEVQDAGVGIAPENLAAIFDRFSKVTTSNKGTTSKTALPGALGSGALGSGGLGIGLYLVKAIAELHRGGVEAFSGGIGMGRPFAFACH